MELEKDHKKEFGAKTRVYGANNLFYGAIIRVYGANKRVYGTKNSFYRANWKKGLFFSSITAWPFEFSLKQQPLRNHPNHFIHTITANVMSK